MTRLRASARVELIHRAFTSTTTMSSPYSYREYPVTITVKYSILDAQLTDLLCCVPDLIPIYSDFESSWSVTAGQVGALNTLGEIGHSHPGLKFPVLTLNLPAEYRLFLEKDNKVISPFHDVPLFANEDKTVRARQHSTRSPCILTHLLHSLRSST